MNGTESDRKYMRRCLQLAMNGKGTCSPNPMVGAVLVYEDWIIGEGWHRKAGEPHAEPNALRSVKQRELLPKSTMYVSLEPCSHFGKTPPCVELIIRERIPRVVIGSLDPFPLVAGRGVRRLRECGVEVTLGVEEKACLDLNKNFFSFHNRKRPRVILKWAQTADGFLDYNRMPGDGQSPLLISDAFTQQLTHKLRSESDAILVGTQTALLDNPSLTVRSWAGNNPLRVVMDRRNVLGTSLKLLDDSTATLIYTESTSRKKGNTTWQQLSFDNQVLLRVLDDLYQRNKLVLLVEGGALLHRSFLEQDLWDEIQIETSSVTIGTGVPAPVLPEGKPLNVDIKCHKSLTDTKELRTITRLESLG